MMDDITRFERARLIGARALQISRGAPPLLDLGDVNSTDALDIARREFNEEVIPLAVRRTT